MLEEQRIAVPLLEGVITATEALGLEQTAAIGGIECRVLLPVPGPFDILLVGHPGPGRNERDSHWPLSDGWGSLSGRNAATIEAVGIIPVGSVIPPGGERMVFDRAVADWRQLLHDWLAVIAEGPTVFGEDYHGSTIWGSSEHDEEYIYKPPLRKSSQSGWRHRPMRLPKRAWSHAIEHACAGEQASLPRVLMASAIRAALTANRRVAIIDAGSAVEIALTDGMEVRLSDESSHRVIKELLDNTRMLGKRTDLAKNLEMPLPNRIKQELVEPRNRVVHKGFSITDDDVKAAIEAAWVVVREYDPLPECCHVVAGRG